VRLLGLWGYVKQYLYDLGPDNGTLLIRIDAFQADMCGKEDVSRV
jgi:hypothetical protein